MRRLEGERGGDVGHALGQRLRRQRVHQVEVEGRERGLRLLDRGARLGRVVDPAERGELGIVEALHADREPRHAGRGVGVKAFALEGARIGLERDLEAGLERQAGADAAIRRSICAGANRLGVPPPMKTVCTRRPHTKGSDASRSRISAST